mgnify:CR=1 FL=1
MSVVERAIDRLRRSGPPPVPERVGPVGTLNLPEGRTASRPEDAADPKIHIDRDALRAAGYLPESGQDRVFADEYRQIKRPLIATAFSGGGGIAGDPRLIMMASALPGDGKTFTSINLALSLARERDTSVVLVDADAAKPHVSQIFGVEKEKGLLDALASDAVDVEALVMPTDIRGLSILPAGSRGDLATELLASDRMQQVARALLHNNPRRLVLFDTSPLLVSSESHAVAGVVGQIVLVVRSGKTPRQAVIDAVAKLDESKAVSLVLNQGRRGMLGGYYGYGSYGHYGQDKDAT